MGAWQLVRDLCGGGVVDEAVQGVLGQAADTLAVGSSDLALLLNRLTAAVKTTPAGRALVRDLGADPRAANTFSALCVQMLQRKFAKHALLPPGKRWADMV